MRSERGEWRDPKKEKKKPDGHYQENLKEKNIKKHLQKKGARPSPRLATAAPSPQLFSSLLPVAAPS